VSKWVIKEGNGGIFRGFIEVCPSGKSVRCGDDEVREFAEQLVVLLNENDMQKQIEEAVEDRWLALRNKIIDELRDQMADDQLQEVLQIVDDEQWFPRFEQALKGEEA